jgi:hypothetical protein
MAHEDAGNYSGKHPEAETPDPRVVEKIQQYKREETITCEAAHAIARELGITPEAIGKNVDLAEIRIVECQNGLFGWPDRRKIVEPAEAPSEELKKAIREGVEGETIPCRTVWDIAARFSISKMEATSVCDALSLKVAPCQLGAF